MEYPQGCSCYLGHVWQLGGGLAAACFRERDYLPPAGLARHQPQLGAWQVNVAPSRLSRRLRPVQAGQGSRAALTLLRRRASEEA